MKTIIYNIDERTVLHKELCLYKENSSEYINKILDQCFPENDFNNYTLKFQIKDGLIYQEFKNKKVNNTIYDCRELPVLIRNIYYKIFNKLYDKYCCN